MRIDIDDAAGEMLGYLKDFEKVLAEGSIEEQRMVLRAFVKEIQLDPEKHKGQAQLFTLPDLGALTRFEPAQGKSSFRLVPGARFEAEKKISGRQLQFDWAIDSIRNTRRFPCRVAVTRCAA